MKKLLAIIALCIAASAQGALLRVPGGAVTTTAIIGGQAAVVPVANATVTWCTYQGNGVPCSPAATVYANQALTGAPTTNVGTTNSEGVPVYDGQQNIYAAAGTYVGTETGSGITPTTFIETIGPQCAASVSGCPVTLVDSTMTGTTTIGGVSAVPPNFFEGTKAGSNPAAVATVDSAADIGNGDRHFFGLRDSSDFDQEGGFAPVFDSGLWHSAGAGASYMARAFGAKQEQCNYTVQAYMYYTSANVVNYIGVTPTATPAGQIDSSSYYAVGFVAGNFVYTTPGGSTTLIASTGLTNNTWYLVSMMGICTTDGAQVKAVVSLAQPGAAFGFAQIMTTDLESSWNVQVESDSIYDIQSGVRYAAGTIPLPSTTVTPTGDTYQTINVPQSASAVSSAWPITVSVNSNPAGGAVNIYAILPPNYSPSSQHPWVFYSHGSGQSGATAFFSGYESQVIWALANAGYVVVTTDETPASLKCWGTPDCVADVSYAVQAWRAYLNLAPRPYAIGESMGGVVLLNAIAHGAIPQPLAVVGIYPTYNLANNYTYNSGLATEIDTAWGCSSLSTCESAWSGYNPALDSISAFASIPVDVWCSPTDTVVQCSANGQALVNAINATPGGSATYNASSGDHGDASNFNPAAVVAFFNSH